MRGRTRSWSEPGLTALLLLAALAGWGDAASGEAPSSGAATLLDEARARWTRRPALEARFTQVQRFAGFEEPLESAGRLRILRPGYFELKFDPPHRQLQLCDGRWVWTYMEEQNQVIQSPLAPDATRGADLLEWALAGARALAVEPDTSLGVPARRIRIQPGEQLPLASLSLWVATDSPELLGYEATDPEGNRTRMRLLDVKARSGLKPSDFRFTPPRGTEVIVVGATE